MNKTADYKFTIIVPYYNEEGNIARLEEALSDYIDKALFKPLCVLFVNDGSTDRGPKLVEEACSRHPQFFHIDFEKNAGKSAALCAGFANTFSEYCGYIDADLQTSPEDFNILLERLPGNAMVTGIRARRKDTAFYRFQSKLGNGWRRMFTHDKAVDTGCPLKVFTTECAKKIPYYEGMHRFIPALVLLQEGATYEQLPIRHFPRLAGESKYNAWNRLGRTFADCFGYIWLKTRVRDYKISKSNLK